MFFSHSLLAEKGGKFNMIWLLGIHGEDAKKRHRYGSISRIVAYHSRVGKVIYINKLI